MNETARLIVGFIIALMCGVGIAVAAAGTTPAVATNHTNATNATDTGGTDGGTDVNIGIVDSSNNAPDRGQDIVVSLGPNSYVSNVEFNEQSETADVTIVNQRASLRLTFTDSNSINPEQRSGTFNQRTENIPRGTYTVRVPATVDEERGGNQLVTIVGNVPNNVYVSNGQTGGASPLDEILTVSTALLGMLIFLGILTARVGYKVWVKSETGSPETLDGTEAGNRAYGMTEQLNEGDSDD